MALRVLIFYILAYIVPVAIILGVGSSPSRPVFGTFGGSVTWDLLRLLILIIGASSAFVAWKLVIQPESNKFRFNPSQSPGTVGRMMRRYPKFYDTGTAEFDWVQDIEGHAAEIKSELKEFLDSDKADHRFRTAYQNNILSLSPTWTTFNLISYGSDNSLDMPRTLRFVGQLPNIFNCNISRMEPRSEVKAHAGEATCYVRCHMGLEIPAEAPTTALHVGGETRSWKEGEVIAFCDGHWHGAVNGADRERLVLIFDVMPKRLGWYTQQYCALMLALNVTLYILPGRFNLDEPLWRPSIIAGYIGLATIGLPLLSIFYLYFKHSDTARPAWTRRLRDAGFGFYY